VSWAFAQAAAGAGIPAWDGEESPARGKGWTQPAENPATQRINGRGASTDECEMLPGKSLPTVEDGGGLSWGGPPPSAGKNIS
jgi:hypothetical protein